MNTKLFLAEGYLLLIQFKMAQKKMGNSRTRLRNMFYKKIFLRKNLKKYFVFRF